MIYYSQIENLPDGHPLIDKFIEQEEALSNCYQKAYEIDGEVASIAPGDDEESISYFDRYIAGDR